MISVINYGGRITDNKDNVLLESLLNFFITDNGVPKETFKLHEN